jgi:hypothetical protein
MSRERLAEILGQDFWTVGVPDMAAANRIASNKMAAGREAVTWADDEGRAWCAWGVVKP